MVTYFKVLFNIVLPDDKSFILEFSKSVYI